MLDRLFSSHCGGKGGKGGKGGHGSSNGIIISPEEDDDVVDPGVPPAPIVDPASFVPHRAMALDH